LIDTVDRTGLHAAGPAEIVRARACYGWQ
jgi:hypothetical protein